MIEYPPANGREKTLYRDDAQLGDQAALLRTGLCVL